MTWLAGSTLGSAEIENVVEESRMMARERFPSSGKLLHGSRLHHLPSLTNRKTWIKKTQKKTQKHKHLASNYITIDHSECSQFYMVYRCIGTMRCNLQSENKPENQDALRKNWRIVRHLTLRLDVGSSVGSDLGLDLRLNEMAVRPRDKIDYMFWVNRWVSD